MAEEADPDDDDVDYKELLECSVNVGETAFAKMHGDHDKVRRQTMERKEDTGAIWAEQQLR